MKKISILLLMTMVVFFNACKNEKGSKDGEIADDAVKATMEGTKFQLDSTTSTIAWHATKVGGEHRGTVQLKEGIIYVNEGQVTGGTFVIDLNTIDCIDQEGEWKDKLERHLKGLEEENADDFFNVRKYPTASFTIEKISPTTGDPEANSTVYGDLTIKGVTKPASFKGMVQVEKDNLLLQAKEIVIDRTEFGVNYNSKKIFPKLVDNIIDDNFTIAAGFVGKKI